MVLRTILRQRYDSLPPDAKPLVRIPRYSHLLSLPHVQSIIDVDRTLARYYWEAYHYVEQANRQSHLTGLLDSGMRAEPAAYLGLESKDRQPGVEITVSLRRKQVTLASKILAAMAFEMFFPSPDQVPEADLEFADVEAPEDHTSKNDVVGPQYRIIGTVNVDKFYEKVRAKLIRSKLYWLEPPPTSSTTEWNSDRESMQSMSARGLEYFLIDGNQSKLQFADKTVQEFFAAVWLTNYANRDDIARMWKRVPDPWLDETKDNDYLEVWRFAAEMPADACNAARWITLFSPFYDSSLCEHFRDNDGSPIRSTEIIYRTWERMKNSIAGKNFRGEFVKILKGDQGSNLQCIAKRMLDGFRFEKPLCQGMYTGNDNGLFTMGCSQEHALKGNFDRDVRNNPEHKVRLTKFWMNVYCVRNAEFELFEPRRASQRAFADKVDGNELLEHPAVNVSWYDAACYARWLGELILPSGESVRIELPTEAQWEYVCRAGVSGTAFSWDGILDDNQIESGNCNFNGNSPWGRCQDPVNLAAAGRLRLGRTIPVDGRMPDGAVVGINRWAFSQCHGNVREWCSDWYDAQTYHTRLGSDVTDPEGPRWATGRVLRGGSWSNDGAVCRAAVRWRYSPAIRDWSVGFRLASVPISPSKEADER